jgi:hypothetical protein
VIVHGITAVPASVIDDINSIRYRERFHLSYEQYLDEPIEEIAKVLLVWEMDSHRAKLEAGRQGASRPQ